MSHWKARSALVVLEAILALTAVLGAVSVVPNLPPDWIKGSIFPDYTIPALALGVLVGGSAIVAALAVLWRPLVGAAVSVVAGVMIVGFELVESTVVGFTLVTIGPGQPQAWLQVVYLAVGTLITILGARLWLALGGAIPLGHAGPSSHARRLPIPSRRPRPTPTTTRSSSRRRRSRPSAASWGPQEEVRRRPWPARGTPPSSRP